MTKQHWGAWLPWMTPEPMNPHSLSDQELLWITPDIAPRTKFITNEFSFTHKSSALLCCYSTFSSLFSSYFLISPLSWASDNVRLCHFLWWQSNNVKTLIKNDIICKCVRLCHFVYELSNNVTTLTMNDIICKCVDLKWHQELTSNDQMKQANPAWLWDFCKNEIEMGLRRAV